MPSIRRNLRNRRRQDKHKPEIVTGSFELHYEDVVQQNRFPIIAIFATGLVLLAVFIPGAVYKSVADPNQISVEVESGVLINAEYVTKVQNDITASGNEYIEFRLLPTSVQEE